jgi:mannose-6-phosphate isomerase-like protein (cupin superfamily)
MAHSGETIRNRATGEEITWLQTAADTGGRWLTFSFVVAPGGALPVRHLHPAQSEKFEMEAGSLVIEVAGTESTLGAGDTLTIAAGQPHTWRNPSSDIPARMRVTFEPALRSETFLEQFFGLCNSGRTTADGQPSFLQIMTMVNRYQIFIAGPPVFVQRIMGWTIGSLARLLGYRSHYPEFDGPDVGSIT